MRRESGADKVEGEDGVESAMVPSSELGLEAEWEAAAAAAGPVGAEVRRLAAEAALEEE